MSTYLLDIIKNIYLSIILIFKIQSEFELIQYIDKIKNIFTDE